MLSPSDMIDFVLKNHGALDDDEKAALLRLKENRYYGSPNSVHALHDITVLYYEACGIQKYKSLIGD